MVELLRTNDIALVSAVSALLDEVGIPHQVADQNMSVLEGSILAIQRRILVPDAHLPEARELLADSGWV